MGREIRARGIIGSLFSLLLRRFQFPKRFSPSLFSHVINPADTRFRTSRGFELVALFGGLGLVSSTSLPKKAFASRALVPVEGASQFSGCPGSPETNTLAGKN